MAEVSAAELLGGILSRPSINLLRLLQAATAGRCGLLLRYESRCLNGARVVSARYVAAPFDYPLTEVPRP